MKKIKTYNIGKNTTFDLSKLHQDLEKGTYIIKTQAVSIYGNKSHESTGLSYLVDPLNPLHLPPFTIRCKFSSSETPAPTYSGVTWDSVTLVDSDEHIWDITKNNSDWTNLFRDNTKLVTVLGANTAGVTDITSLFLSCSELVYIPLFDTSNVTSMKQTFAKCTKLTSIPHLNTANVTNMRTTFALSGIEYIPDLDTHNVTDMFQICRYCTYLVRVPNFNTQSVTDLSYSFTGCELVTYLPSFDTSNCTNLDSAFAGCKSLKSAPSFDTSKSTNLGCLFQHCHELETVGTYDASSATTIERMYFCCEKLKRVNPMSVKAGCNMSRVFDTLVENTSEQYQSSLEEIPNWNWTKASNLAKVFRGCTALTSIPDMGVPTNATTCASMFENCPNISSGITRAYNNLSSSSSITTHTSTFKNCGSNTTTGSAELAQIPQDWGGTME